METGKEINKKILVFLIIVRSYCALQNSFLHYDEFFQSVDIVHRIVRREKILR